MIDALKLAEAPKAQPLTAKDPDRPFTCAICGARQEPFCWRVTLPNRLGSACTGCAADAGWSIR